MISDDFMDVTALESEPPLPDHLVERITRALYAKKGIGIDLYRTVARTPFTEPIEDLRSLAGWMGLVDKDQFLKICLTTNFLNPDHYIDAVADTVGLPRVDDEVREKFRTLIREEKDALLVYPDAESKLVRLQEHYKLSLITNSWPFPVTLLLVESRLGNVFGPPNGDVVMSSRVLFSKQDGPEIYRIGAVRIGLEPADMVMIGDNPVLDVKNALLAGYTAILCDRYRDFIDDNGDWKYARLKEKYPRLVAEHPDLFDMKMPVIRNFRQLPDPNR